MSQQVSRLKIALFTLLISGVMTVSTIVWLVFTYPSQGNLIHSEMNERSSMAHFEVTSDKLELEKAINGYLRQHVQLGNYSFYISLTDQVQFNGDVNIMGEKVRITILFNPVLQPNGDLVLEQHSFKIGLLKLPSSLVLEFVKRSYNFPEWIELQPANKQIYVATTGFKTPSGIQIQIREFDLVENHLIYDVFLPGGKGDKEQ